jgi:hypothetical protein
MPDSFKKTCGEFTIEVSPPSPRWVTVYHNRHGDKGRREEIGGFSADDLHDLKYLVDRALAEVSEMEREMALRMAR